MEKSILASRYILALKNSLPENEQKDAIAGVFVLLKVVNNTAALKDYLLSPIVSNTQKKEIIKNISEKYKFPSACQTFFNLLIDKNRLGIIPALTTKAYDLVISLENKIEVKIFTPLEASDLAKKDILNYIRAYTEQDIIPQYIVDENIIAGFRAEVGNIVFDGTLNNTIEKMKEKLEV